MKSKANYLIAVDLEGIHGVVGSPTERLIPPYEVHRLASENAVKEINAIAEELFKLGETEVIVWDNHGNGNNLDHSKLFKNVTVVNWRNYPYRLGFCQDYNFKGVFFLGYHCKSGTIGGVLAHTYSTACFHYYKFNGKDVGEFDMDSMLLAKYNIAPYFFASDNLCISQMKELCPDINSVTTKISKARHSAELLKEEEVLENLRKEVRKAVNAPHKVVEVKFPIEVSQRFVKPFCEETPEVGYVKILGGGYDGDCYTVKTTLNSFEDLEVLLDFR